MKTLSEILQNPYEFLATYETMAELLMYGPYIVMHNNYEETRNELSYTKKPLLKYMLDMAALLKVEANATMTFYDKKQFLLQVMKNTNLFMTDTTMDGTNLCNWCATRINQCANAALTNLRRIQYENSCLESAMTGYAPIIPYGTPALQSPLLRKKKDSEKVDEDPLVDAMESVQDLEGLIRSTYDIDFMRETLLDLLINHGESILENSELTYDHKETEISVAGDGRCTIKLPAWLLELFTEPCIFNSRFLAQKYYFISYILYLEENGLHVDLSMMTSLCEKANQMREEEVPSFESLLEMSDMFSTPDSLDDIFDPPSKLSKKFTDDKEKEEAITTVDKHNEGEQEKDFNADILLGYIYTHRRFKQDKYTNQAFLSQYNNIEDYSYMANDIMICVVKEKYLCSPAIDLAGVNNYQPVLICLDKDDNIQVVSSPDDLK